MKRILCTIIMLLLLTSCVDNFNGKRPINYPNTKWVSENPEIYFEVIDGRVLGEILCDGQEKSIEVWFNHGTRIFILSTELLYDTQGNAQDSTNATMFYGECKFSPKKLIVKITNNEKGFLPSSVKEITFLRENL